MSATEIDQIKRQIQEAEESLSALRKRLRELEGRSSASKRALTELADRVKGDFRVSDLPLSDQKLMDALGATRDRPITKSAHVGFVLASLVGTSVLHNDSWIKLTKHKNPKSKRSSTYRFTATSVRPSADVIARVKALRVED